MMKKEDWINVVNDCESTIEHAENVIEINNEILELAHKRVESFPSEPVTTEKPTTN